MFERIFHPEAEQELLELSSAMQGKAFAALAKLETQGNQLRFPQTDILQNCLYESRAEKKTLPVLFLLSLKTKKYSFSVYL